MPSALISAISATPAREFRSVTMGGKAATILWRQNGALIDSHDLVIRFNRAHVKGIEDKIGSRTDLLVANAANLLQEAPSFVTPCSRGSIVAYAARSEPGKARGTILNRTQPQRQDLRI
jgi:Glycosyltransferase family 29 (sialyltransferase)